MLQRIRGDERRAQLMDVALALFAEHGYDGTSTRVIASAAGVTEGLIFKYFPTKRDLLHAVMERHAPCPEHAELEASLEALPIDQALVTLLSHAAEEFWENRDFIRMVIMECYRQGEAFQEMITLIERGPECLRRLLDRRVEAGEIAVPDTAAAAEMLGGALFTFFQRHQHRGEAAWRERSGYFIRTAIALFLKGALNRESVKR